MLQEDNGSYINNTDVAATDADGEAEEAIDSANATAPEIGQRELLGPQP
jgi:hypothetical protein